MYLVLILFFFPETRYVLADLSFSLDRINHRSRNMTIEEVSVLFDTGRKGDAAAATRQFHNNDRKLDDMLENDDDDDNKAPNVSRVERV